MREAGRKGVVQAKALFATLSLGPLLVCMKAFEVKGQFRLSVKEWQPFTIEVASTDEKGAVDKLLALIGSRHNVKRAFIKIDGVKLLKSEEITNHTVKYLLEAKK
ncbi:MAG: 50S ribosomal protein L18a [Candidatus Thermoplasmatota archaeon]|nr:50S ribosomal protein L18a [Candidatus Thermoplasmatota archaeon]